MAAVQTRRKLRLGRYMRALRERSGRKPEEAAKLLGIHRTTITRMESGHTICRLAELHALTGFYGATDDERSEAQARWEDAKQDAVRVALPGTTSNQLRSYLRAEADAAREKIVSPLVIDGLLQTADYARAVILAPSGYRLSNDEVERAVEARMARQARLRGPRPLAVHAVIDEGVIRRVVGGPETMRKQLEHLLDLGEQDHITLQIVPYTAGAYGTMSGGSAILEFPDPDDPPAAYIEYVGKGAWVEDEDDVGKLLTTFDEVAGTALAPADTAHLFRQQIEALRQL